MRTVGVGASAGGLDAIVSLFAGAEARAEVAYVVVQHLSQERETLLPELLSERTSLPVVAAQDGIEPAGGTVYVMLSTHDLVLRGGRLRCVPRTESAPHLPIDAFFASLADELGAGALGIVLSGTGSDGTRGAAAIRATGGLVFVQEPSTCAFAAMATSVIDAGAADRVLAPDDMVRAVNDAVGVASSALPPSGEDEALRALIALLSRAGMVELDDYRPGTLLRRARHRAQELGLPDLGGYVDLVSRSPEELAHLEREALIGVSSFFRDSEAFELLERLALPRLFEAPGFDGSIRGWTCGCSAGQEAYSLAISLAEAAERAGVVPSIKLFATDIDRHAIARASAGVFPRRWKMRSGPPVSSAISRECQAGIASIQLCARMSSSACTTRSGTRRSRDSTW